MNRDLTETAMGTAEILIVFSALMALVALVTVGIDWIGKPLKHRRFIPRIYRFPDEKLPIDEYGHTDFGVPQAQPAIPAAPLVYAPQPQPVIVARVDDPALVQAQPQNNPAHHFNIADTVAIPVTSRVTEPKSAATRSAFSDSLAADKIAPSAAAAADTDQWLATGLVPPPATEPSAGSSGWKPGMALDATIDDRKPNLATKAQRFWTASAVALSDSHFDEEDLSHMSEGKAPRRNNPRTGRTETMQLTGLRQASRPEEVSMRWPEDSVDPWQAT